MRLAIAAAAALAAPLAGCYVPVPDPIYTPCAILASSDWRAWLEEVRMPGGQTWLVVTGKVTVPTGGYRLVLEPGYLDRLKPPRQQVMLRASAPEEAATQAVVTQEVRTVFLAPEGIGGVAIRCGDGTLAEIDPLETRVIEAPPAA